MRLGMRLDRFLTLALFSKFQRDESLTCSRWLPILMYHSISEDPEVGIHPYYRVATHPQRFSEQMEWLAEEGWKGVSLEEALPRMGQTGGEYRRLVGITFDDGFRDFYTTARALLEPHGFTATMYLPTSFVASSRRSFRGKECLVWDEVKELRAQGIRFGSHTVHHAKLYELPWNEVSEELIRSKGSLEEQLAEEVTSFAYPYAFPQEDISYTKAFTELVRECGYRSCVTTVIGRARVDQNLLLLKRLPANSCDDRALFIHKVNGGYDWLGSVQRTFRQLKQWSGRSAQRASATPLCFRRRVPDRMDNSI